MSAHAPNGINGNGHNYTPVLNRPTSRQVTVGEIARLLGAELVGDAHTLISGVSSLDSSLPDTIAFIEHEGLFETALGSSASAFIAPTSIGERVRSAQQQGAMRGKPAVLTGNPRLAFAKVMEYLQPPALPEPGIHPTAIIEKDAHIGEGVTIREYCYVGHHAHIGDGVVLYPHVVVGDGAQIGNATILYPSVVLNHHVHIGERVRIHSGSVIGGDGFGYVLDEGKHHKVPQIGTVIIEDDVEIGANVCIDRAMLGATRVGTGTKVDNLVQIAHNVQIGRNVIVCALVGLSGSVVVEDDVIIAGQVGARDHVKIGKGAQIGAQAGVMNDIAAGSTMLGSPAGPHRDFMKMEAATRKLPEALRALRQLERQVKELQETMAQLSENSE
jgi:UDP-3-O-[3-hydroxymyristoyl] glucosamine N-acyltransferase